MSATQFFPGMSFADTITNSSQAIPGPNVIRLILPRGISLRTVAPYNMFGRTISSTYCAWPVTLSRPSFRGTDTPTMGLLFIRDLDRRQPRAALRAKNRDLRIENICVLDLLHALTTPAEIRDR